MRTGTLKLFGLGMALVIVTLAAGNSGQVVTGQAAEGRVILSLQQAVDMGLVRLEAMGVFFGEGVRLIATGKADKDYIVKIEMGDIILSKSSDEQNLVVTEDRGFLIRRGQRGLVGLVLIGCIDAYEDPPMKGQSLDMAPELRKWAGEYKGVAEELLKVLQKLKDLGLQKYVYVAQAAIWLITDDGVPHQGYDIAKAREILRQAGVDPDKKHGFPRLCNPNPNAGDPSSTFVIPEDQNGNPIPIQAAPVQAGPPPVQAGPPIEIDTDGDNFYEARIVDNSGQDRNYDMATLDLNQDGHTDYGAGIAGGRLTKPPFPAGGHHEVTRDNRGNVVCVKVYDKNPNNGGKVVLVVKDTDRPGAAGYGDADEFRFDPDKNGVFTVFKIVDGVATPIEMDVNGDGIPEGMIEDSNGDQDYDGARVNTELDPPRLGIRWEAAASIINARPNVAMAVPAVVNRANNAITVDLRNRRGRVDGNPELIVKDTNGNGDADFFGFDPDSNGTQVHIRIMD